VLVIGQYKSCQIVMELVSCICESKSFQFFASPQLHLSCILMETYKKKEATVK
jgi:hypothetical protein